MFGLNLKVGKEHFRSLKSNELKVTSSFGVTLQGEGPYRGMPAYFVRLTHCQLSCHFCFGKDTYISMGSGPKKKISEIQVGDEVIAYNEKEGIFEIKKVTKVYESFSNEMMRIKVGGGLTFCTPNHPFLVRDKGWVAAENLKEGDTILHLSPSEMMRLRNPMFQENVRLKMKAYHSLYEDIRKSVAEFIYNGKVIRSIKKVTKNDSHTWIQLTGLKENACKVYNLEVEDLHTYVANGMVVHNCDTYFDKGEVYTFDQIFDKAFENIDRFYQKQEMVTPSWAGSNPRKLVLVVTGGEPTLQNNLGSFLKESEKYFYKNQIESNGLLLGDVPNSTTYVVSPKCLEKDGVSIRYYSPNQKVLERADCLKFVMSAPTEKYSPYSEIPKWALEWRDKTHKEIFVSPMNMYNTEPKKAREMRALKDNLTLDERSDIEEVVSFWEKGLLDMEQNQRNHEYAALYALKYGLTFNLQVHLFASLP